MKTEKMTKIALVSLVVLGMCGSTVRADLNAGLISHWKFDEGSGSVAYDSAGNNDGILMNSPTWTTGQVGGALSFDDVDDYVEVADEPSLRFTQYDSFTICFWAKPSTGGYVFSKLHTNSQSGLFGYAMRWLGGSETEEFQFMTQRSGTANVFVESTDHSAPAGSWYFVTAVYDSKDMELYLNAELKGTGFFGYDTGSTSPDNKFAIGVRLFDTTFEQYFGGLIDEVRVYNRALSAGEIMELYGPPSPPEPVAHWKFDEGSGSVAYDSAGNNDGILMNSPTWTTGQVGGALSFDDVDDYVEVADEPSLRFTQYDSFTICFWAKPSTGGYVFSKLHTSSQSGIFGYAMRWLGGSETEEFQFMTQRSGTANVFVESTDHSAPAGSWYFVTAVYDSKDMELYLNAELKGTGFFGYDTGSTSPDNKFAIGVRLFDTTFEQYFGGLIDEVRIYNRALSALEIMEIYAPPSPPGPVAHWKFDEGMGSVAYDSAGNNDGTIYGAQWTTGVTDGALDFDGVDDYVEVPDDDSLTPSDQITLSFWMYNRGIKQTGIYKYASCPGEPHSPGDSSAYFLCVRDDTYQVHLQIHSATLVYDNILSSNAVALNEWHYLTGTFNQGNAAVYIDGQLENTDIMSVSSIMNDVQPLIIGGFWNYCKVDTFHSTNGKIDDVRIYERALSSVEIEELYQSGFPVIETYHIDGFNGSDLNDGLTKETAFATIQKGINSSDDGDMVLVWPGVYNEAATQGINFKGKAITVTSAADAAVLEVPGFTAVTFAQGEDGNSIFSNFVVRGSDTGILALFANPTINNVTIVNNDNGVIADNADPEITNCIFWNNFNGDLFGSPDPIEVRYSWFEGNVNEPNMPAAGQISHWKFDEGGGLIAYDSAGNNDAVVFGAIWTTSPFGNALDFDGVDDYVEVADDDSLDFVSGEDFSVSLWIKSISNVLRQNILQKFSIVENAGYALRLHSFDVAGQISFQTHNYNDIVAEISASHAGQYNDGNWHHLAGVRNQTTGKIYLYVDGAEVGNADEQDRSLANSANLLLGVDYRMDRGFFDSIIDNVSIYNRALSAGEIEQIYEPVPNPVFADAAGGDYHLKSERGRYWPAHDVWVLDDETSPCIDGGDPGIGPTNEPMPNGGRINMGAYGNTAYSSMSECRGKADINCDGIVNFRDLAIFAQFWLEK